MLVLRVCWCSSAGVKVVRCCCGVVVGKVVGLLWIVWYLVLVLWMELWIS